MEHILVHSVAVRETRTPTLRRLVLFLIASMHWKKRRKGSITVHFSERTSSGYEMRAQRLRSEEVASYSSTGLSKVLMPVQDQNFYPRSLSLPLVGKSHCS